MAVKEHTDIQTLEQLLEASPDLRELRAELGERESRRDQVIDHVADLVKRQRELRSHLAEATTEADRTKARAAVATTAGEAAILPDEATMANEAFALALHRWASGCIGEVEALRRRARGEASAAVAEAVAAYEEAEEKREDPQPHRFRSSGAKQVWQRREGELKRIRRQIVNSCRPVFPHGEFGTLTNSGELHGHERWLARERAEVEETLRA